MINAYLDKYDILSVCFESNYQKIYMCKHKETEEIFLLNSIVDKLVVNDVDFYNLKNSVNAIVDIIETEDTINIITKHEMNSSLIDYVNSYKMTISSQINLTTNIMDKIIELKNQPNKVFLSFFNHFNLEVDSSGSIHGNGVLLLSPNYINTSTEEILRTLANVVCIIFSGKQIEGNVIPKDIPPDISKLIANCLENKYIRLIDLVSEYKSTSLYKLINPEKQESKRVHNMRKSLSRKRFKYKLKSKGIIVLILIIPIVAFAANKIIDIFDEEIDNSMIIEEPTDTSKDDTMDNHVIEDKDKIQDVTQESTLNSNEVILSNNSTEDIFDYFNEDIECENEDKLGVVDSTKYHRGTSSIRVSNQTSENETFLVGYIDLNDDKFSFLKDRVLNVSLWVSSSIATEANIILKLETNKKILFYTSEKLDTVQNNWIMKNIGFNSKNAEHLKIYITVAPYEELWIDSIEVDILK